MTVVVYFFPALGCSFDPFVFPEFSKLYMRPSALRTEIPERWIARSTQKHQRSTDRAWRPKNGQVLFPRRLHVDVYQRSRGDKQLTGRRSLNSILCV